MEKDSNTEVSLETLDEVSGTEATQEVWDEVYRDETINKPWIDKTWVTIGTEKLSVYLESKSKKNADNIYYRLNHLGIKRKHPKLLDYGGGNGQFAEYYKGKGYEVTLVDISEVAINMSPNIQNRRVVTSPFDLNANEKFDVILCWAVLHHIHESKREEYVKELKRHLHPWGMLIIGAWDKTDPKFENKLERTSHVTSSTTWNISTLLEKQQKSEIVYRDTLEWYEKAYEFNRRLAILILADRWKNIELRVAIGKNPKIIGFQTVFYNHNSPNSYVLDDSESMFYFRDNTVKKQISELFQKGFRNLSGAGLGCSLHSAIYKCLEPKRSFYWQLQKDIQGKIELSFYEPNQNEESTGKDQTSSQTGATDFIENSTKEFFSNMERGKDNNNSQYKAGDEDTVVTLMNTWLNSDEGKKIHYYALFLPILDGSGVSEYIDASLDLFCEEQLTEEEYNAIYAKFAPWSAEMASESLLKKIRQESIKSAIAAIMSRNMSHNLGSHFISNTKNYFNALVDVDAGNESIYRGVKNALQYIQERMDFIATITSNDVLPYGAVNAKAQIFDELTPDDLGYRHGKKSLNFLLDYLVLSEKISKRSFENNDDLKLNPSKGEMKLILSMGYENEEGIMVFWNSSEKKSEENSKRDDLVKINLAIPGGVLGRHAVFSIIENIIRNAAKHGQDKIVEGNLTIKMLCTKDGHFVIFDNKLDHEILKTVKSLNHRLNEMKIIDDDNTMNQDNKGLKEILTCAAWLQNADVTQVFQSKNYDDYVKILAVDENGKPLKDGETKGYLGYSIKLERFKKCVHLSKELKIDDSDDEIDYALIKGTKADVVCASKDYKVGKSKLSEIFPRFLVKSLDDFDKIKEKEDDLLKEVIKKNFDIDVEQVKMVVSPDTGQNNVEYNNLDGVWQYGNVCNVGKDDFLFKGHAGKSKWSKFETLFLTKDFEDKYIDSISGGDFTHTIVQPSFVKDPYNRYKILESVKTRFVIIDERLFEQYHSELSKDKRQEMLEGIKKIKREIKDGNKTIDNLYRYVFNQCKVLGDNPPNESQNTLKAFLTEERFVDFAKKDIEQHYLERKNIFLFSIERVGNKYALNDLSFNELGRFEKEDGSILPKETNYFKDAQEAPVTFLSIHLGLIDKVKDSIGKSNDNNFDESKIVESLREYFGANFVTIHSGRGGYDIRESLKKYVFQSYSAVENPLHNSKFLLSQQFYNLNYYGTRQ